MISQTVYLLKDAKFLKLGSLREKYFNTYKMKKNGYGPYFKGFKLLYIIVPVLRRFFDGYNKRTNSVGNQRFVDKFFKQNKQKGFHQMLN